MKNLKTKLSEHWEHFRKVLSELNNVLEICGKAAASAIRN